MIRPLVLALLLASPPSGPVSFPDAAEAKDPTGRYAVVEAAASGSHALDLRNLKTGVARLLQPYGLAAVVLWSPDGGAVAVTDRDNRETSSARVFFPDRPGAPVDLGAELERAFPAMGERTGQQPRVPRSRALGRREDAPVPAARLRRARPRGLRPALRLRARRRCSARAERLNRPLVRPLRQLVPNRWTIGAANS